jgi:hypothetical protein
MLATFLATSLLLPAAEPTVPVFEKEIRPLLEAKCLRCHGGEARKAALDMRGKAGLLKGGESGPAVTPGSAEKSLLWVQIAAGKMPPGKEKLTTAEKTLLRAWIDGGARGDDTVVAPTDTGKEVTDADRAFWSFRPPVRPAVPTIRNPKSPIRNPVDAFLLAELEKKGLTFSPEADRLTLLRRATFDLTGLPPTPEEVERARNDPSAEWFEHVVDRLLASPRYGERWGRHWLDLAGYADSEGILDADYVRTAAWRYRDYVIRAFNADKPYDRFLKEQIAGDELTDYWSAHRARKELPVEVVEGLTATGYLRCASDTSRPDFVNIKNAPGYYFQTLDDTVKILSSGVMGLTLQCARCHSHKYDPIPQSDYYRMQAIFMSGYRPGQWVPQVQRRILEATESQEKEVKDHNAKVDAAVAALKKQLDEVRKQYADQVFADRLKALPDAIREDVRIALATEAGKRTEVQKYLADKFKDLRPAPAALAMLDKSYPMFAEKIATLTKAQQAEEAKRRNIPEIRAFYDLPGDAKTFLLRRGDYLNPGFEVRPGVLAALTTPRSFDWKQPAADAKTSGRRLAFAEWLTQPDHPLTARVFVNRVWLHHFGEGLVSTPDNFGRAGSPPSHPALLDWLATEFVRDGWSTKRLHRLLMTSTAYRQSSARNAGGQSLDPENRLLWRQRLRRLEAESLRDAILTTSGDLNLTMYGPPVPMVRRGDGEVVTPADATGSRRSVYLQVRRSQPLTILQVFDQPVIETNCTRRSVSTVSSQALTLLNSEFLSKQADVLAGRVLRENPGDAAGRAVFLAFGRSATESERTKLMAFLKVQTARHTATPEGKTDAERRALADLCQMLLSANEFVYID